VKIHPASISKKYKKKIGTLKGKKIWQTSKQNCSPADVLSESGENPDKIRINLNPDKIQTPKLLETPELLETPNKPVKFDEVEGVHHLNSKTLNTFFEHEIVKEDVDPPFLGQFENQLNLLKGSERTRITKLLIAKGENPDLKTLFCKEKN
jgi:hypothetical protein